MEQWLIPALGLADTFINVPRDQMGNYAYGYSHDNEPSRVTPGVLDSEAYGVKTTAADLIRFVEANMGLIKLDQQLQRAITDTHTGYFKAGALTQDLAWEQYPYPVTPATLLEGNGAALSSNAAPATAITPLQQPRADVWINKTGSTNGFGAYMAFVPQKQLGIVILANKNFPIIDRVTDTRVTYRLRELKGGDHVQRQFNSCCSGHAHVRTISRGCRHKPSPAMDTVIMQRVPVPGTDWEMGMGVAEFPPNSAKPRQKAIGPEVCFVSEGEVTVQVAGQPSKTFHTGEAFQPPANVVHVTTAGPAGAEVVATWAHIPGKQFNTPVPN